MMEYSFLAKQVKSFLPLLISLGVNPCVNPNQECVNSQCQCKPGYTWDFVTRQCKQEIVNVGDRGVDIFFCYLNDMQLGVLPLETLTTQPSTPFIMITKVIVITCSFELKHSKSTAVMEIALELDGQVNFDEISVVVTVMTGVTCTIGAAGRVGSVTFEFTQDRVIANGAVVPVFPTTIGPVTFGNSGGFTASFDGVIVSFSGFSLRVEVPDTYANGTSGLCGVFNYNPADDYTVSLFY